MATTYYNENTVLYLNGEYVKAAEATMDLLQSVPALWVQRI